MLLKKRGKLTNYVHFTIVEKSGFPHTCLTEIWVLVRFLVLRQLAELGAVSHYLKIQKKGIETISGSFYSLTSVLPFSYRCLASNSLSFVTIAFLITSI